MVARRQQELQVALVGQAVRPAWGRSRLGPDEDFQREGGVDLAHMPDAEQKVRAQGGRVPCTGPIVGAAARGEGAMQVIGPMPS